MESGTDRALQTVAAEVLESLAFMWTMPPEGESEAFEGTAVEIEFEGAFSGALVVRVSPDVLAALGVGMLGLMEGDTVEEALQHDALRELTNVICGALLPVLAGTQEVFHVGTPAILEDGAIPATWRGLPPRSVIHMLLDTGRAELALFLPEEVGVCDGKGALESPVGPEGIR